MAYHMMPWLLEEFVGTGITNLVAAASTRHIEGFGSLQHLRGNMKAFDWSPPYPHTNPPPKRTGLLE